MRRWLLIISKFFLKSLIYFPVFLRAVIFHHWKNLSKRCFQNFHRFFYGFAVLFIFFILLGLSLSQGWHLFLIGNILSELPHLPYYIVFTFQDSASIYSCSLVLLHHKVCYLLILVLCLVYYTLYKIILEFNWSPGMVMKVQVFSVWSKLTYFFITILINLESFFTYIFIYLYNIIYLSALKDLYVKIYIIYFIRSNKNIVEDDIFNLFPYNKKIYLREFLKFFLFSSLKNFKLVLPSLHKTYLLNLENYLSLDSWFLNTEFILSKQGYSYFDERVTNTAYSYYVDNAVLWSLVASENKNYLDSLSNVSNNVNNIEKKGFFSFFDILPGVVASNIFKNVLVNKYYFQYLNNTNYFNYNTYPLTELIYYQFESLKFLKQQTFIGSYIENNAVNSRSRIYRDLNFNSLEFNHNFEFEVVWATGPSLIILMILSPSLKLLYSLQDITEPVFTFIITGNQWYWGYEFNHYVTNVDSNENYKVNVSFLSNMVQTADLLKGEKRLLQVDNILYLPVKQAIRFLITSSDVLHAWAIPSLGIKSDAVPGRLNQVVSYIIVPGRFYGQCSELCGVSHGFMPIVVEAIDTDEFISSFFSIEDNNN